MASEKCKACGMPHNTLFYICPYCGVKKPDEELLTSVELAYNADDSAAARRFYKSVLARDRKNVEAYWGLFLLDCGVKDRIYNDGILNARVPAENYIKNDLTEQSYENILLNENFLRAFSLAEGDFKKRIEIFKSGLERRMEELAQEKTKTAEPAPAPAQENKKPVKSNSANTPPPAPKTSAQPSKGKINSAPVNKSPKNVSASAPQRAPRIRISGGKWAAAIVCCLPLIVELLAVLLIPKISVLAENVYLSRWGWQALTLPLKISFISLIVLGFLIQLLGLFGKLNKPLGMFTQIISFGLFVLASYAAHNNGASVYAQWGLAMIVPVSLLVTALRYVSSDMFGFVDDFNFWYYLPIALEVAEYLLFFLVFPLMFKVSVSLWFFVAITVTTVASIGVSCFWEDFHWAPVGINLAVAALLCVIFWLGRLFSSEWLWNGGIIIVVILAIGGSWFIHWFIHRNDDQKIWK